MRQVTIEKIISCDRIRHRADRRIRKFKEGEIVKFNTADGVKIAVVTADKDVNCRDCVFVISRTVLSLRPIYRMVLITCVITTDVGI